MEASLAEAAKPAAPEQIADRLRASFGKDRAQLTIGEPFRVYDEDVRVVAYPQDIAELSELMKLAAAERWRVVPAGAGGWLEMGNQPVQQHVIVSTARMSRVFEYEPADLTAAVEAGCTLAEFNARAAEHRQFIPLDPFGAKTATLGAIVATASHGPLRYAYGTPRDWVIGMRVVHADGSVTKAGGKVVKNVAGYDLCKLYTGSFGTLAIIAELNFKLRALPAYERTLVFYADAAAPLCELAARISDSDLQPAAIELLSPQPEFAGEAVKAIAGDFYTLALRFLSEELETIDAQLAEVGQLSEELEHRILSDAGAADFWQGYHASETAPQWVFSLRVNSLPADLGAVLGDVEQSLPQAALRAHAGNGVVRVHAEAGWLADFRTRQRPKVLADLREAVRTCGGSLVLLRAPDEIKEQIDVWGEVGPTTRLMREIKEKFDPAGRLNYGRFVAGI